MSENSLMQAVERADASATIDLLGQTQLEGAVIIYDNSQEVVKLVTSLDSGNVESMKNDDIDNLITLHAASEGRDSEIEENINLNTIPILDEPKIDVNPSIEAKIEKDEGMPEEEEEEGEEEEEAGGEEEEEGNGEGEGEVDSDDDETIATFVTSTGQQLALYAVENSDQVFAVALYDESGEPPTNFHFVMKDDVERLIEEGAVRTVKKKSAQPVQLKESKPIQKHDDLGFQLISESQPTSEVRQEIPQNQEILPNSEIDSEPPNQETLLKQDTPSKSEILSQEKSPLKQTSPLKSVSPPKTLPPQVPVSPPKPIPPQIPETLPKSAPSQIAVSPSKVVPVEIPVPPPKSIPSQITISTQKALSPELPVSPQKPVSPLKQSSPQKSVSPPKLLSLQKSVSPPKQVSLPKQIPSQKQEIWTKKGMEVRREIVEIPEPKKVQTVHKPAMFFNKIQNVTNRNIVTKPQIPKTQPSRPRVVSNISNAQMKNKCETSVAYIVTDKNEAYILDRPQEEIDSDTEILEQSTVQYILCDGNSDDELTFDELQRSLQNFNNSANKNKPVTKIKSPEPPKPQQRTFLKFSPTVKSTPKLAPILTQRKPIMTTMTTPTAPVVYRTYSNTKKPAARPSASQNFFQISNIKIKKEIEDSMPDDFDESFAEDSNVVSESETDTTKLEDKKNSVIANVANSGGGAQNPVKVKRPRKQQLTAVNRPDSEIIIQQASVYSEEESEPIVTKKRGRRKKRLSPDPEYNPRKSLKRSRRSSRAYELIEIDVDESERGSILEVTLDGNAADIEASKVKGSSDKENDDIISVRSSEEESEEEEEEQQVTRKRGRHLSAKHNLPVECNNCSRNFPSRRSLTTHLHTCKKKSKSTADPNKKFKCKSCNDLFDAALTLARHVRMTHSPKKRVGRPAKGWVKDDKSDTTSTDLDDEDDEDVSISESSEPEPKPERKKRGRPKRVVKEESPSSDFSLKLESSSDLEPKKQGRQSASRSDSTKERSASTEVDEKNTSEPRRRPGRPKKKSSSSKDERSVSPEVKEKPIAQIPKKRGRPFTRTFSKDERSSTPEVEKKNETDDALEAQKKVQIGKKSLSKDEKSANPEEEEDKSDSQLKTSTEEKIDASECEKSKVTDTNDTEPPAESEKTKVEEEKDEKLVDESKPDEDVALKADKVENVDISLQSDDKLTSTIASEEKFLDVPKSEQKNESAIDDSVDTRIKVHSTKEKLSKEEKPEISELEAEEHVETSTEPRRRGRRSKRRPSSNNSETPEPEEKSEPRTRNKLAKDKSLKDGNKSTPEPEDKSDSASESRTRSRTAKDKLLKDEAATTSSEPEEKDPVESRKRGRPPKDRSRKVSDKPESDASDIEESKKRKLSINEKLVKGEEEPSKEILEVDNAVEEELDKEKKLMTSSGRSWKVKKLNCSDCGKWFSSAAALDTHRLQHRTKKTGKLVQRCQICKNFVPVEMFSKHMTAHKKTASTTSSSPSTSSATSPSSKPMLRHMTAVMQPKRLVRNVLPEGVKRPNVRQLRSSN